MYKVYMNGCESLQLATYIPKTVVKYFCQRLCMNKTLLVTRLK